MVTWSNEDKHCSISTSLRIIRQKNKFQNMLKDKVSFIYRKIAKIL